MRHNWSSGFQIYGSRDSREIPDPGSACCREQLSSCVWRKGIVKVKFGLNEVKRTAQPQSHPKPCGGGFRCHGYRTVTCAAKSKESKATHVGLWEVKLGGFRPLKPLKPLKPQSNLKRPGDVLQPGPSQEAKTCKQGRATHKHARRKSTTERNGRLNLSCRGRHLGCTNPDLPASKEEGQARDELFSWGSPCRVKSPSRAP